MISVWDRVDFHVDDGILIILHNKYKHELVELIASGSRSDSDREKTGDLWQITKTDHTSYRFPLR
jgi:hypothetical protein